MPSPCTSARELSSTSCGESGRPAASMAARIAARWRVDRSMASLSLLMILQYHYHMILVLLSLATFASTLGGGLLASKLSHRLHYLLSFTAGVLLGLVAFDVVPEIF